MSSDSEERAQCYIRNYAERTLYAPERHQLFHRSVVEEAWPPTGEQDHRPAGRLGVTRGELSGLALAFGGNRSDPGLTTAQRAERAFNDNPDKRKFRVYFLPQEDAYEFHRIK